MIGSGLKKLAQEHNMTISDGVAYGGLHGYAVTLSEGMGYKTIVIATKFTDPQKGAELLALANSRNLMKEFRVLKLIFAEEGGILVQFHDNPGTMKKLRAFVDWFFPLLPQYTATGVDLCFECGLPLTGGSWKLMGDAAFHLHESCADRIQRTITQEEEARREADTGSYLTGLLGAALGGLLGAIPWAALAYLGYFAAIVGFLIGWLVNKGYDLLHGKQGKGKVVILILTSVLSVVLGTLAVDAVSLAQMIAAGELPFYTYADIPYMIAYLFLVDSEYLTATLLNLGMGLLFAFLGLFGILRQAHHSTKSFRMKDLH